MRFALLFLALLGTAKAITPAQRDALVAQMEYGADFNNEWREMYAYGPVESAYYSGRADGFLWAASVVAVSANEESRETLIARFESHVQAAGVMRDRYSQQTPKIKAYSSGYAEGIEAGRAMIWRWQPTAAQK